MTSSQILIDGVVLLTAVILFWLSLRKYHERKKRVGTVWAAWSLWLNPSLPWGWVRLAALLVGVGAASFVFLARPLGADPLGGAVFIALVLAFYPCNSFFVIGSEGVLDRWVFIPWDRIRSKQVVEMKSRRYLELEIAPEAGRQTAFQIIRRRVPEGISLDLPSR